MTGQLLDQDGMCELFIANRTLDAIIVRFPLHVRTLKLLPRHRKEAVWPPNADNLRPDITFWKEVSRGLVASLAGI